MAVATNKINLRDLTKEELVDVARALGEKPFRATQIYSWLYARGATSIEAMTDLSLGLREELDALYTVEAPETTAMLRSSEDETIKFALKLADGAPVESVIIPTEEGRLTLCVSSQTGCSLDCAFCLTGAGGPGRNLTPSEIYGQLLRGQEIVSKEMPGNRLSNIVLMGMGEPLLNYDSVMKFVKVVVDQKGAGFAPRRVTISTAGVVPMIERLAGEGLKISLAVSLNATTDEVRDRLMPINRKYPISALMAALEKFPVGNRRHITIEYVLIGGVNDSADDAKRLARLLEPIRAKVNLIPFNPHPASDFTPPDPARIDAFQDILYKAGYVAVRRASKGRDILAACGQLSGRERGAKGESRRESPS
jgi:23S rRNA (adenine2503-C2)-methyltransferase